MLEFAGPGIKSLPIDFRNGIDVMTTETTCLSSIWETDEVTRGFYEAHKRPEDYQPLHPGQDAYYDKMITIDLSKMESMIALPFHPSNAWTIHEFLENAEELLQKVEADAKRRFPKANPQLTDKIHDGAVWADQGVIAAAPAVCSTTSPRRRTSSAATIPAPAPSASTCTLPPCPCLWS